MSTDTAPAPPERVGAVVAELQRRLDGQQTLYTKSKAIAARVDGCGTREVGQTMQELRAGAHDDIALSVETYSDNYPATWIVTDGDAE